MEENIKEHFALFVLISADYNFIKKKRKKKVDYQRVIEDSLQMTQ